MNVVPKRVFISKLPEHIGKTDLESKFGHYGKVASVEVISRKNGDNQPPFAFVNLETSDEDLHRCIRDFANKKWKGEFLDVQVAKESFLAKLKREREEVVNNKQVKNKWESKPDNADVSYQFKNNFRIEPNNKRKKIYFEEQKEGSEDEVTNYHLPVNGKVGKIVIEQTQKMNEDSTPVKETNSDLKEDPKYIEANQKRIQSTLGMINQYKQQKLLIRSALSNLDGKAKNKIVFDTDADEQNFKSANTRAQLFNEDSNDEEDDLPDFGLKEHFEGKEGQKLLQLQSRFKNDKRFVMNEKFLENNEENANGIEDVEDEKQTQLNILEKVLGTKVTPKPKATNRETQKVMLRFDPEDPEHKAYELKLQEEQNTATKKKKRKEMIEAEEVVPEVSNTKFYKVADDLKNVFQTGNKPFSLLSASNTQTEDADEFRTQESDKPLNGSQKKIIKEPSATSFNDDSTDGEEEEEVLIPRKAKESATDRVKFWSEPFFFNEDDFRFQEGSDFIKRMGSQEGDDFLTLRRNLKEVVRAKVRNINRKNGMFKKKLGGAKKRMRIKRALKRS